MKGSSQLSSYIYVTAAAMLKSNIDTPAPVFTRAIKQTIESSTVPAVMKHTIVTLLLMKSGLDPVRLANYRPISNFSFISKLLERYIAVQFPECISSCSQLWRLCIYRTIYCIHWTIGRY